MQVKKVKQEKLNRETCNSIPTEVMDRYVYPCEQVIAYEKTLIKDCVVWKLAEREAKKRL